MTQQPDLTEWDDDVTVSDDEDYAALVRAIQWAQGFGLLFVQCSPAEGERLVDRVQADVTEKAIAVLRLDDEIEDLYEAVKTYPSIESTDVLFVTGLEKSLTPYIKPGYGSEGDYYAKDTVPKLLGKLNLRREQFREDFPVCFVFLVPSYAMKYLTRRAADFFDWRSGIWEFATPQESLQQETQYFLQDTNFEKYKNWKPWQRKQRVLEIEELFVHSELSKDETYSLRYEQSRLFLADIYTEDTAKCIERAIECHEKVLNAYPDMPEALQKKGLFLRLLKRYEEAIACYEKVLEIKPDDPEILFLKGSVLNDLKRFQDAIVCFDRVLKLSPRNHEALNNKGEALRELRFYEAAITSYNAALAIKPDYAIAYNNKGFALNRLKRHDEALAACDAALVINPSNDSALYNKGVALGGLGCAEEAISAYDAALAINPNYAYVHNDKGVLFYGLGKYEAAVECYNKALAINPNYQNALNNRKLALAALEPTFRYERSAIRLIEEECAALTSEGTRLHRLCRYEEAIPYYSQALAKKADYYEALHHKGAALAAMGHQEAAIDCYDKVLKIQPDDHDTLCDRGKALGVLGRYEDALNDYDRALTLQPKSTKARYGKQEVRSSMTGPKVAPQASTHSQQPTQNFFQHCIAACAQLWTAFWNFTKSLFRL